MSEKFTSHNEKPGNISLHIKDKHLRYGIENEIYKSLEKFWHVIFESIVSITDALIPGRKYVVNDCYTSQPFTFAIRTSQPAKQKLQNSFSLISLNWLIVLIF